jgi:hypothetical protein
LFVDPSIPEQSSITNDFDTVQGSKYVGLWELNKLSDYRLSTRLLNTGFAKKLQVAHLWKLYCTVSASSLIKKKNIYVHERQDFIGDVFVLLIREEMTELNFR